MSFEDAPISLSELQNPGPMPFLGECRTLPMLSRVHSRPRPTSNTPGGRLSDDGSCSHHIQLMRINSVYRLQDISLTLAPGVHPKSVPPSLLSLSLTDAAPPPGSVFLIAEHVSLPPLPSPPSIAGRPSYVSWAASLT